MGFSEHSKAAISTQEPSTKFTTVLFVTGSSKIWMAAINTPKPDTQLTVPIAMPVSG